MGAFQLRIADLPTEFAIFPLAGALLLPQGRLPLNIFEPRYLAMTEDAMAAGRMFAMIQPDMSRADPYKAENAGAGAPPALYRVGCLGRLVSFSETDDGRFLITLDGLIRFRLVEELAMHRGYRRVRGDFSAYAEDLAPATVRNPAYDRAALLDALRAYFTHRGLDANWDSIAQLPDDALVLTLCMACPFDPLEKQALLEAPSPADRAQTLLALLRIDTHQPPSENGDSGHLRAS
jgi:Lon protease-like protein